MNKVEGAVGLAGLCLFALAACNQSAPPAASNAAGSSTAAIKAASSTADLPKVPFGNQPCQSLSEQELTSLGFNMPTRNTASRTPDDLPIDNTCTFESVGAVSVIYNTRHDYEYQRDNLRKTNAPPPAGIQDSFYDVLGNLWFAKHGFYVSVTNVGQPVSIEKVTAAVAAKL